MDDKLYKYGIGITVNINKDTDVFVRIHPPKELKKITMVYFKFLDHMHEKINIFMSDIKIKLNDKMIEKEENNKYNYCLVDSDLFNPIVDIDLQLIKHFNNIDLDMSVLYEEETDDETDEETDKEKPPKTKLLILEVYYIGC